MSGPEAPQEGLEIQTFSKETDDFINQLEAEMAQDRARLQRLGRLPTTAAETTEPTEPPTSAKNRPDGQSVREFYAERRAKESATTAKTRSRFADMIIPHGLPRAS